MQHSPLTKKKNGNVFERLGTPRSSKSCPPRKRNLKNEVGPWMQGCAPQNTTPNIRPPSWYNNDEGQTDNENEEEDEISTAGTSEEEDNE